MVVHTGTRIFGGVEEDFRSDTRSNISSSGNARLNGLYRAIIGNFMTTEEIKSDLEDATGFMVNEKDIEDLQNVRNFKEFEKLLNSKRELFNSKPAGSRYQINDSARAIIEDNFGEPQGQEIPSEAGRNQSDISSQSDFLRSREPEDMKPSNSNRSSVNPIHDGQSSDTASCPVTQKLQTACRMYMAEEIQKPQLLAFFEHMMEENNVHPKTMEQLSARLDRFLAPKRDPTFREFAMFIREVTTACNM